LAGLKSLKELYLSGTHVEDANARALKHKLPKCWITGADGKDVGP